MPVQDSDLLQTIETLVEQFGVRSVTDADDFRAILADWVDAEDAAQARLLVDAVRLGALDLLRHSISVAGSDPEIAVAQAAEFLQKYKLAAGADVRWDPCQPITYPINTRLMPPVPVPT